MTTLTIIRGLPGSGKSTLAKLIKLYRIDTMHFEADMYFMNEGKYEYDGMKIGAAHEWCQSKVDDSLWYKQDTIVSNTFTRIKEMRPYFDMAKEHKAEVNVIHCQGNFKNIHGVPDEVMENMRKRFAYDISELWEILK